MTVDNDAIQVRKGIQGLSKAQLVEYFRRKDSQRRLRDDAIAVLTPDRDDENADLVSEVNPMGAIAKMHQKWMIHVYDPDRDMNLLKCWDVEEDRVMMMLKRQRVWEIMAVKNAVSTSEEANKDK